MGQRSVSGRGSEHRRAAARVQGATVRVDRRQSRASKSNDERRYAQRRRMGQHTNRRRPKYPVDGQQGRGRPRRAHRQAIVCRRHDRIAIGYRCKLSLPPG